MLTGSLGAAPDLRPPSHQDQSLIPLQPSFSAAAYYAQECPSPSPPLITPAGAGKWGAGVNLEQIPKGASTIPNRPTPTPPPPPPPLFFTQPQLYPQLCPCDPPAANHRTRTKTDVFGLHFSFPVKKKKRNAAVVIYYPINASCGKTMRRPVPLICSRPPRTIVRFQHSKRVLAHDSQVFPLGGNLNDCPMRPTRLSLCPFKHDWYF